MYLGYPFHCNGDMCWVDRRGGVNIHIYIYMYISLYIYTYIFGDLTQMPTAMHIQVGVGSIRKRIDRYPWQNLGLTSAREIAQQDTRVAKGFP